MTADDRPAPDHAPPGRAPAPDAEPLPGEASAAPGDAGPDEPGWFVYLVRCRDDTLYCGVCTDLARRLEEHNTSPRGARYTRARRPVTLAWHCELPDRSAATRAEARIKRLSRQAKERLCRGEGG